MDSSSNSSKTALEPLQEVLLLLNDFNHIQININSKLKPKINFQTLKRRKREKY